MARKFRRKKHIKITANIITIIIILIAFFVWTMIRIIGEKMTPGLLNYAEKESTKLVTIIVRQSITDELISELDSDNLFIIKNNSQIGTIDINSVTVNKFIKDTTTNIQYNLKCIEEGDIDSLNFDKKVLARYDEDNLKKGIFTMMPTGVVFNSPILINLSPKIPLKMSMIGNVITNIDTKVTNYGINNALIELSLNVTVNIQVLLPVRAKEQKIELSFPVMTKIVQGNTPNLIYGGLK